MKSDGLITEELRREPEHSLTASHLLEYLFCPRFTYFEYVLGIPQHEEKRFKVEVGRKIHERVRKANPGYLRKKLGVNEKKLDVYLSSPSGLRGIVDEVLFWMTELPPPLITSMQSIRTGHSRTIVTNWCYAQLIKDNFQVPVTRGFIIYTRSRNKLIEVPIKEKDFVELGKIISGIIDVLHRCKYPNPTTYKARCPDCCYRNICEKAI